MIFSSNMAFLTQRNQVSKVVRRAPVAFKFAKWANVVNVQLSSHLIFCYLAFLAMVIITMAHFTALFSPVWAIVRFISTLPMPGIWASQLLHVLIFALIGTICSCVLVLEPSTRALKFRFANWTCLFDFAFRIIIGMIFAFPILIAAFWRAEIFSVFSFYIGVFFTAIFANFLFPFVGVDDFESCIPTFGRAIIMSIMVFIRWVYVDSFTTDQTEFISSRFSHDIYYIPKLFGRKEAR